MVDAQQTHGGVPSPAGRFLHIFHSLRLQPEEYELLGRKKARLSVTSKALGQAATPAGGIMVRRPFANKSYLVGGSKQARQGWVVALPEGMKTCDLTADWEVPLDGDVHRVRHRVEVRFASALTRGATVYSMHPVYWHVKKGLKSALGELAPMSFLPYATLTTEGLQAARTVRRDDEGELVTLREVIQVPAAPLGLFKSLRGGPMATGSKCERVDSIAPNTYQQPSLKLRLPLQRQANAAQPS